MGHIIQLFIFLAELCICYTQHGANVHLPNERGDTPLHNAAK